MDIEVKFKYPEDNHYWALFSNSEELAHFVKDTQDVLRCVKNNGNVMLEPDITNLLERSAFLLAQIYKDSA